MAAIGRNSTALAAKLLKKPFSFHQMKRIRYSSITGYPTADKALKTVTGGRVDRWLGAYERTVGLTEVREAQGKVIQGETQFLEVQEARRRKQTEISAIESELRTITAELEKTHRGEERYLNLLTEEHTILQDEKRLREQLEALEREEKAKFAFLSSAVRESHEKERARSERVKYWSIMGSIIGAAIGIMGTSINNYLRMRELRGIVSTSAEGGQELRSLVGQLSEAMKTQHNQVQGFVSDLKSMVGRKMDGKKMDETLQLLPVTAVFPRGGDGDGTVNNNNGLQKQTEEILAIVQKQEKTIDEEMKNIKEIVSVSRATDSKGNVVYVGPEIRHLLEESEKNIETRLKMNALWTAVFIYGGLALTLPVLLNIFK